MSKIVKEWRVGSRWSQNLKVAEQTTPYPRISVRGPFGEPPTLLGKESRVVMFCQGTGIVPLLPLLQDLLEEETETMVNFSTLSYFYFYSPGFYGVQHCQCCGDSCPAGSSWAMWLLEFPTRSFSLFWWSHGWKVLMSFWYHLQTWFRVDFCGKSMFYKSLFDLVPPGYLKGQWKAGDLRGKMSFWRLNKDRGSEM